MFAVVNVHHRRDRPKPGGFVERMITNKWVFVIGLTPLDIQIGENLKRAIPVCQVAPLDVTKDKLDEMHNGVNHAEKRPRSRSDVDDKELWLHFAVFLDRVLLIVHAAVVVFILVLFQINVA